MESGNFKEIDTGLIIIPLNLKRRGFRNFISSWILRTGSLTILVDPGPTATISDLKTALIGIGISRLDYILLTHIHIDHAGGTGLLSREFPRAKIICHSKAIKHLMHPSKLWEASKKVLGPLAEAYGEIVPVKKERIFSAHKINHGPQSIVCLETPGHAAHHISYGIGDILFVGEAAGVFQDLGDGDYYLRPATPPVFHQTPHMASIDRLIHEKASCLCFGHFGVHRNPEGIFVQAKDQIARWVTVVKTLMPGLQEEITEKAFLMLKKTDLLFARFDALDPDIQDRERYFFGNTIQGIMGFLEETA